MIEFYNVQISTDQVTKRLLENKTKSGDIRLRYAFAAIDEDGTKMLKFCKKEDYDSFR